MSPHGRAVRIDKIVVHYGFSVCTAMLFRHKTVLVVLMPRDRNG